MFFKIIYVTLIISSSGSGDVSSCPLLPGLFWRHFLLSNILAGCYTKVAIHFVSLSLPLGSSHISKRKQQSNDHPMRKEGVLPELPCPHQLEPSNHTREPSPLILQVPLLLGKDPLIYMHVLVCLMVECEIVCSQSCVSGQRLPALAMGGHDGADATYSCSSFASYSYSSCSYHGRAER
jgi:hypothetical protein